MRDISKIAALIMCVVGVGLSLLGPFVRISYYGGYIQLGMFILALIIFTSSIANIIGVWLDRYDKLKASVMYAISAFGVLIGLQIMGLGNFGIVYFIILIIIATYNYSHKSQPTVSVENSFSNAENLNSSCDDVRLWFVPLAFIVIIYVLCLSFYMTPYF
ncbi:MAG: hypothetical protein MRZ80_07265 [Methanosphaera sp.]|uniref:hypothetical protein n=1 Tax=Methanosphaera sp. TaxID=2666342 RepID=UPI0025E69299|nr:hypothetical protein [Methanosphaera sp.]MCI5867877.1 hypothetical protein [Methanosphaera sp.]